MQSPGASGRFLSSLERTNMEAAAPDGKERCLGSGETQPIAGGKDDVAGLPHQLHLLERRVPQALMRDPEGIDPNDPCRLASRLSRGEGQVHLEVGAVDGVAERVEERGVTLERANRLLPLVLIRESQRDVVLVLLRVGVSRQVSFLHHRDDEQRLREPPVPVPPPPPFPRPPPRPPSPPRPLPRGPP